MSYIGDFNPSDVFSTKFTTVTSSGTPDTFTTSPAVVIYKDNITTPVTTGVTLNTNFNSVTGLNNLTIDTSTSAGFYASGHDFMAVISAGTAGGVSIAGYVVAEFSIQHRSGVLSVTTQNAIADVILGRNIAGGSSGGRTVSQALYPLRNKWTVNTASGVYSVFLVDDVTLAWTGSLSTNASAVPIIGDAPST